jgi:UDPglucose--hexose-1-phosphate uridylyltransferase
MSKYIEGAEGIDKEKGFPSELRYDIASKDWVVVATGRSKRPETFKKRKSEEKSEPTDCPFCQKKPFKKVIEIVSNGESKKVDKLPDDWAVASIPNKFPAFIPDDNLEEKEDNGLYRTLKAVGFHEVIITNDHYKSLGKMSVEEVREVLLMYRSRYLDLMDREHVNYISIFHNHGKKAGASIDHPHSQLITTPLVDNDVNSALKTAKEYKKEKESCLYCDMQNWEIKKQERIVYQNDNFLVICPFASKVAFQTIISPKKHSANFEKITEKELIDLADAFQKAMSKLYNRLGNPDYNFYLHTAPCDGEKHNYYHWHWTIMPKTGAFGGFELGAAMEISTIKPEDAANHLKKI